MDDASRNIPLPIKREVRQRCRFGCVVCGNPIYEYDHIREWAEHHEHTAEGITLLCPNHHTEVTSGRLPRAAVIAANRAPHNKTEAFSTRHPLYYNSSTLIVQMGSALHHFDYQYGSEFVVLRMYGQDIISINRADNMLLISAIVFDEQDRPLLQIEENELLYSLDNWDVTFIGNTLQINNGPQNVCLRMAFETPNKLIVERAKLYHRGHLIEVEGRNIRGINVTMSGFNGGFVNIHHCADNTCGIEIV